MGDAQERYRNYLKLAVKSGKKFEEWIQDWKEVIAEGICYKVLEAISGQTWIRDLLNTVLPVMTTWVITFKQIRQEEITVGSLSHHEVAVELLNDWRDLQANKGILRYLKAGFLAL